MVLNYTDAAVTRMSLYVSIFLIDLTFFFLLVLSTWRQDFTMEPRLAQNALFFCLGLPSVGLNLGLATAAL